jgi:hypothetical protein
MRLEATEKADEYKVWLTDSEIEALRRATAGYRDDVTSSTAFRPWHPATG